MIVAGEASGDLHGSGLVNAMKKTNPALSFFGMGGQELKKSGVEIICNSDDLAVMGITEVFSRFKSILSTLRELKKQIDERKPALLVLIDFADFNLQLAKKARKSNVPVYYYITPKVWVWRKKRVKKLAKFTNCAGVILPFEENYLRNRGVNAQYVGNPVVDEVNITLTREDFCNKYSINNEKALVGILPGSRKKEIKFLLPIFLEAAKRMKKKYSRDIAFLIPLASTLTAEDINHAGLADYKDDMEVHVLADDKYELMAACDGVVAASGTVTLELALLNVPMVVAYKFSPLSYLIGRLLVHIRFFSLVNILAEKEVVTELLQDQVNPASIELELARILFDENVKERMKNELSLIRERLGKSDASKNAAKLAFSILCKNE